MPHSTTRFIDFSKLQTEGQSAALIVTLMMACNDMSVANESLMNWKSCELPALIERKRGARMYFVRLQIAHLHEALKIIEKIEGNESLLAVLNRCDETTKDLFNRLLQYSLSYDSHNKNKKLLSQIRNNLTFHYDGAGISKCVTRAIASRANSTQAIKSSITQSTNNFGWHFKVADDIVDTVVTRQFMQIESPDASDEVDQTMVELHQIFSMYMNFSGEFIWRYFDNHAHF